MTDTAYTLTPNSFVNADWSKLAPNALIIGPKFSDLPPITSMTDPGNATPSSPFNFDSITKAITNTISSLVPGGAIVNAAGNAGISAAASSTDIQPYIIRGALIFLGFIFVGAGLFLFGAREITK